MTTAHRAHEAPWAFDPVVLGHHECKAWTAYYRHAWLRFLRAAVGMVSTGFGMGLRRSLLGAWHVLRANQAWAPFPANDPDAARVSMRRFYALVRSSGRSALDPDRAAALEVAWWDVHRRHQHDEGITSDELVQTLNALYAYVYDARPELTRPAAEHRVAAMDLSDEWVRAGRHLHDPLIGEERRALVASYTALRDATDRGLV